MPDELGEAGRRPPPPTSRRVAWTAATLAVDVAGVVTIFALIAPTWSVVAIDDPNAGSLAGMSCSPGGRCLAYGQDDQILTSPGGQGPWTVAEPLPGLTAIGSDIGGVSCFTGGCLVTTRTTIYLNTPVDPGWSPLWTAPDSWVLGQPACPPSGTHCLVFANDTPASGFGEPGGHEAVVTIDGPLHDVGHGPIVTVHRVSLFPARDTGLISASCPTARVCEGVSPNGVARTSDGGATWHTQLGLRGSFSAGGWTSVECPSVSTCLVGAGNANLAVTHDGGRHWSFVTTAWSNLTIAGLNQSGSVEAIDCASAQRCLAAVSDGEGVPIGNAFVTGYVLDTTDGGHLWTRQGVPGGADLDVIACTRTRGCWTGGSTDTTGNNSALLFHAAES